jgi:hypothetical protein
MKRILVRLSAAAALIAPIAMTGALAAPAYAAGATCAGNSGSVTFSPGLTSEKAKVQNIVIHGSLSECTGSTVTGATYAAKLKSAKAATCATLAIAGETASGSIVVKWSPKGQGNSHGSVTLTETGGTAASITGTVTSGLFAGLGISGSAEAFTPMFTGSGAPCTKKNPLKKATFTGSGLTFS